MGAHIIGCQSTLIIAIYKLLGILNIIKGNYQLYIMNPRSLEFQILRNKQQIEEINPKFYMKCRSPENLGLSIKKNQYKIEKMGLRLPIQWHSRVIIGLSLKIGHNKNHKEKILNFLKIARLNMEIKCEKQMDKDKNTYTTLR